MLQQRDQERTNSSCERVKLSVKDILFVSKAIAKPSLVHINRNQVRNNVLLKFAELNKDRIISSK